MEEEEGLGVRRHVDVVLKVSEERAVRHRLGVVLRRKLVTLRQRDSLALRCKLTHQGEEFFKSFSKLCHCACNTLLLNVK